MYVNGNPLKDMQEATIGLAYDQKIYRSSLRHDCSAKYTRSIHNLIMNNEQVSALSEYNKKVKMLKLSCEKTSTTRKGRRLDDPSAYPV